VHATKAFYAVSLHSARFTETSLMGYFRENTFKAVQKASLGFCIIGTILMWSESYAIGFLGKDSRLMGMNQHTMRSIIGAGVLVLEDIPQLCLCGVYLNALIDEGSTFKASDDPLTSLSLVLSSLSFVYNFFTCISQYRKGKAKDSGEESFDGFGGNGCCCD
jgi:hypothetical protein